MRYNGHAPDERGVVSQRSPAMISMSLLTDDLFDDVPQLVTDLEASARLRAIPCGEGNVLWRMWGEGPVVVLFHGAFGSWTHWARSIGALAEDHQVARGR